MRLEHFHREINKGRPFRPGWKAASRVMGVDVDVAAHTMRPAHQMTHRLSGLFFSMACRVLGKITPWILFNRSSSQGSCACTCAPFDNFFSVWGLIPPFFWTLFTFFNSDSPLFIHHTPYNHYHYALLAELHLLVPVACLHRRSSGKAWPKFDIQLGGVLG